MRFAAKKDVENAVELALGRSWGGRKFHANLAQFQKKKQGRVNGYADLEARCNNQVLKGGEQRANLRSAGWILDECREKGIRVASWSIKQQKTQSILQHSRFSENRGGGLEDRKLD